MNRDTQSRRQFVRAAVVTTGGVALAGCSSSGDSSTDGSGGGGEATDTDASEGGGESGATQTSTVEMTDELGFAPKTIQVSAGTEVTWENTGSIGHTVTAYEDKIPDGATYFASGDFDSEQAAQDGYKNGDGNIGAEGSYSHTFETTGTYEYYCIPHEMNGMVGTVEVV